MKKYLFGLGAMLVGAGLMFVLMQGEVSADDVTKVTKITCEEFEDILSSRDRKYRYCKINHLTCVM